ncbi:MAG: outer membrane beta-barrel protein [Edaphocola sp.]
MNKVFGLFLCIMAALAGSNLYAQRNDTVGTRKIIKPSRDFVMVQLTYENWAGTLDDIKIGGIGRGFNAYICYDFPISKSNFSFAAGIGVGTSNIYFDDQVAEMNTSSSSIDFKDVDDTYYKKSKLATAYLEAPFELRFFGDNENRNRGFKAAVGVRVGMLVDAHSKVKHSLYGPTIVEKVSTKRYVQGWRFAPTARIGWGNFSLFGSYNVTQLFNSGEGPSVYPYSIGLCVTGL